MLPTQLLRNHAGQIGGAELDQTLVWLYQVCCDQYEGQGGRRYLELPHEERMRRFRDWLTRIFREEHAVQDTMKIERFFARELPFMRDAWREALGPDAPPPGWRIPRRRKNEQRPNAGRPNAARSTGR